MGHLIRIPIKQLSAAAIIMFAALLAVLPAFAQSCDSLTGFAKQACLSQATNSASGIAGAADSAMKAFSGAPLTTSLADAVQGETLPPSVEPKAFEQAAACAGWIVHPEDRHL